MDQNISIQSLFNIMIWQVGLVNKLTTEYSRDINKKRTDNCHSTGEIKGKSKIQASYKPKRYLLATPASAVLSRNGSPFNIPRSVGNRLSPDTVLLAA